MRGARIYLHFSAVHLTIQMSNVGRAVSSVHGFGYTESSTLPPLAPATPLSYYSNLFLHNQYNNDHYSPHTRPPTHFGDPPIYPHPVPQLNEIHSRQYVSPLHLSVKSMTHWNKENPPHKIEDYAGYFKDILEKTQYPLLKW